MVKGKGNMVRESSLRMRNAQVTLGTTQSLVTHHPVDPKQIFSPTREQESLASTPGGSQAGPRPVRSSGLDNKPCAGCRQDARLLGRGCR